MKSKNDFFYLKLCMFVDVLCSLSVQNELGLIGNADYVVLHGMAEQPLGEKDNLCVKCTSVFQMHTNVKKNMLT